MLKKLTSVVFLMVLLIFAFGCNSPDAEIEVYNNGIIKLEYPKSWTPHEEDFGNIIITNFETPDNDFQITINLSKLREGVSAEEQFKLLEEEISSLEAPTSDINSLENDIINIAGQDAVEIIFLNSNEQKVYRLMTTFDGYLMSLEAQSSEENFEEFRDIVNQMVSSLEILIDH